MMSQKVLFIGLGVMGFPMAGHLSKHFETYVYNRTATKAHNWLETYSGKHCESINDLPANLDVIITCIGNDDDLRETYLGDSGLFVLANAGTLFIDHTTASATVAKELSDAALEHKMTFIDAPVSGGEQGAINGQLTIMCGGTKAAYERAEKVMTSYAKTTSLLGENGAGQLTKMCNQIAVAGVVQGLAESIHFAEQAGLDCHEVIKVIAHGAAGSWQMNNRHDTMIKGEYEHGFAVDLMRKDLNILLSQARQIDAKLPTTALIDQFYADVQAMGGNRWDTSSLLERLRKP